MTPRHWRAAGKWMHPRVLVQRSLTSGQPRGRSRREHHGPVLTVSVGNKARLAQWYLKPFHGLCSVNLSCIVPA